MVTPSGHRSKKKFQIFKLGFLGNRLSLIKSEVSQFVMSVWNAYGKINIVRLTFVINYFLCKEKCTYTVLLLLIRSLVFY